MEKMKHKGRFYLDQIDNYIKVDDKGRKYVNVKCLSLNTPSQWGSTHVLIVDTWNAGKREEKEPTCCWLEPIKTKVSTPIEQVTQNLQNHGLATPELPKDTINDPLPF